MVDSMAWRGMAWVVVYHVRVCLYVYTYKCVRICVCLLHTFISTYQTHLIFFFYLFRTPQSTRFLFVPWT